VTRAFTILSWITSVLLGCFSALAIYLLATAPDGWRHWQLWVPAACLTLATLLLFPPLWEKQKNARARRLRLVAAVILSAAGLFAPTQMPSVVVDLPVAPPR
jgi:hypothetical protein